VASPRPSDGLNQTLYRLSESLIGASDTRQVSVWFASSSQTVTASVARISASRNSALCNAPLAATSTMFIAARQWMARRGKRHCERTIHMTRGVAVDALS